jgi:GT2 family glycosyltransferase
MYFVTASLVLFKNEILSIKEIISSLLMSEYIDSIFLIDNSPTDILKILSSDSRIEYIHNPSNPGFGAAHNIAIKKSIEAGMKFHFIVNPDIFFRDNVINKMILAISMDSKVGMMMPQILNLDGSVQYLPKLLPSPLSILWRKIKKPVKLYSKFIFNYELRFVPNDVTYNAPVLSGCFTLLNLKAIVEVGLYDDKYFMYFEDWDLSRRMHKKYKTLYFPKVSVYHGYESGANKNWKLFKIFIKSAITYFNKWGWFFDSDRRRVNRAALEQFNK